MRELAEYAVAVSIALGAVLLAYWVLVCVAP